MGNFVTVLTDNTSSVKLALHMRLHSAEKVSSSISHGRYSRVAVNEIIDFVCVHVVYVDIGRRRCVRGCYG